MADTNAMKDQFGRSFSTAYIEANSSSQVTMESIYETTGDYGEPALSPQQIKTVSNNYDVGQSHSAIRPTILPSAPSYAPQRSERPNDSKFAPKNRWRIVFALLAILVVIVLALTIMQIYTLVEVTKVIPQGKKGLRGKIDKKLLYRMPGTTCLGTKGDYFSTITQRRIYPPISNEGIDVYCDDADGGGWMIIQFRPYKPVIPSPTTDESSILLVISLLPDNVIDVDDKDMDAYVHGFGNTTVRYWMGLDLMHKLTSDADYELRIDLEDWCNNKAYAHYRSFKVGDPTDNYRIYVSDYSGTAGDSLASSNGQKFSTTSILNTNGERNQYGSWWFSSDNAFDTNLNGKYYDWNELFTGHYYRECYPDSYRQEHCRFCMRDVSTVNGIYWKGFGEAHGVLKMTKMKIRVKPGLL